jgi:hypothetical protein
MLYGSAKKRRSWDILRTTYKSKCVLFFPEGGVGLDPSVDAYLC